jgi:hypothetical protein
VLKEAIGDVVKGVIDRGLITDQSHSRAADRIEMLFKESFNAEGYRNLFIHLFKKLPSPRS